MNRAEASNKKTVFFSDKEFQSQKTFGFNWEQEWSILSPFFMGLVGVGMAVWMAYLWNWF